MDFKIGYTVRPRDIVNSVVIFEEEVETPEGVVYQDTLPTKDECLAYGFNWGGGDSSRPSVCSVNTVRDLPKPNNMLSASRLDILGADVNNTLVVGDTNQVEDFTNNSIVAGRLSKVSATNSIVLGGNSVEAGAIPLVDNLVENGRFNEIGAEEVLNGDFSEIGGELVENGSFTPGIELVENGNFQDFVDATDSNLDGGVQFADWNVNPSNGLRRLTTIVDGFRNDVIEKQTYYWQQRVNQSVSTDLEVGKYYRFKAKFTTSDGSGLSVRISEHNGANTQAGGNYPTEAGIYQKIDIFFKCTSITGQLIDVYPNEIQEIGGSFSVENVSLKEVGQEWNNIGKYGWEVNTSTENGGLEGIAATGYVYQGIGTVSGKYYKVVVDATVVSGGCYARGFNSTNIVNIDIIGRKTYTAIFSETDTNPNFGFSAISGGTFTGTIHSVSVKEVGQDWKWSSAGADWSIGSSPLGGYQANSAGLNAYNSLFQEISGLSTVGKTFSITFTVSNYVSGTLALGMGGYITANSPSSDGTHTVSVNVTNASSNNRVYIRSNIFNGSVTNISVKEVLQGWKIGSGAANSATQTLVAGGLKMYSGSIADNANSMSETTGYNMSGQIGKTYILKINATDFLNANTGYMRLDGVYDASNVISFTASTTSVTFIAYRNFNKIKFFAGGADKYYTVDDISLAEVLPYGAKRQSIQLLYGYQSTDGSNKSSFLNGITDSLFAIPENSVMYFHADVVAVRVGGVHATGAVGDYGSWVERGVIINKSGVLSINRERDTIKSSGSVTNWQPTGIVDGTNFAMRVRGHTDMTIEWASNITFTEIITGVAL